MTNFTAELNVRAIRKLLNSKLTLKPTATTKKSIDLIIKTVQLINKDLAQGKFHLDLSDKRLNKEIGATIHQAKNIRQKLSTEGITYIPKGQKQTGPGTYPNWMVAMTRENKIAGIVIIHEVEEGSRKKLAPVHTRYNKTYCDIYYGVIDEIFEYSPTHWTMKDKMINVHILVNEELALKGLTRDDCRI